MDDVIAEFDINYAYNQFSIIDESAGLFPTAWTNEHCRQGFCRSLSAAGFMTLDQWGIAHIIVKKEPIKDAPTFMRLIAIPFVAETGVIAIHGPEDPPPMLFTIAKGNYRLWVGQSLIGDNEEEVNVYFEGVEAPVEQSELVIKDEFLKPGDVLLEY